MPSSKELLERIGADLARQTDEWKQAVESLESFDAGTMFAVPPDVLEAIDDACQAPVARAVQAPLGSIRA